MATWQHLRSSTANKRPTTSLADGRIAINTNTASPGLFFKDSAGTGIVKVGPVHVGTTAPNSVPASGGSTGNYTGEQWLDTSVSPAQMKVWNGSTWVGIVADELPVSKLQDGAARQLIQTDAAGTGVEWTSNVDVPGTLDVTSTATFDSIAQHPLGTAGAPTITFTGDTNTGLYSPGADQVAISTNGTGRLFVDASGNVGVGPVSTSSFQSASSTVLSLRDTASSNIASLKVLGGAGAGAIAEYGATNGIGFCGTSGAHDFAFYTNSSERMRLDSSGRLGLGTSSPDELLTVYGGAAKIYHPGSAALLKIDSGLAAGDSKIELEQGLGYLRTAYINPGTGLGWFTNIYGYSGFRFLTDNAGSETERVRIDSSGRVGVGVTSVSSLFQARGTSDAQNIIHIDNTAGTTDGSATNVVRFTLASNGGWANARYDASQQIFNVNGSEAARIDGSRRLLVGASTSVSTGNGYTPGLQVAAQSGSISASSYRSDEYGGIIALQKSKSATVGTQTVVSNNDQLGLLSFEGSDGTNFEVAAQIQAYVDGTPGANDMPGRLVFATTADGAASPTERMRLDSSGRLGVGTTSAISKLHVSNSGAEGFEFTPGSATNTNLLTHYNRNGSFVYVNSQVSAASHQFFIGASEAARIDSSGRLGLGTSSADNKLSVGIASADEGIELKATYNGARVARFALLNPGVDNTPYIGSVSGNDFGFITSGTRRMTLTAGGSLGIGTTAPNSVFQVNSGTNLGGLLIGFNSGSSNFYDADLQVFRTGNGTERARIDSSGRLLVGTSTAAGNNALQIHQNNADGGGAISLRLGLDATSINAAGYYLGTLNFGNQQGGIGAQIRADSDAAWSGTGSSDNPSRLVFSVTRDAEASPTERMRINNAGATANYAAESVYHASSAAGAGTTHRLYTGNYSATATFGGTTSFLVWTNGNVENTNNSYGAISDIKLKENIVNANSQWNDLKALQVRNYNFKEGQTHTQIGLIAQEAELISPGLVSETPDRDAEGNDLGTVTKSVNYSVLYMKAVKALQEAMERIEQLENSNADLLARVTALEAQ